MTIAVADLDAPAPVLGEDVEIVDHGTWAAAWYPGAPSAIRLTSQEARWLSGGAGGPIDPAGTASLRRALEGQGLSGRGPP